MRPILALLALLLASAPARAQEPASPPGAEQTVPRGRHGNTQRLLEQRVSQLVQRQLQASPQQMQRLRETNRKYAGRRLELVNAERRTRRALRREILAGDRANQQRVDTLLRELIAVQRQRLDVFDAEQGELAAFLTPVQRAKYAAIQERLLRMSQQLRQRRQSRPAP